MNALDLTNAVFIQNQQIKTDSLKVAEAFGKNHKDVLRRIDSLDCPIDFTERNFALSEYKDSSGRILPMHEMSKDGWMFLVMGFTGAKAAQIKIAFIEAFNQMAELLQNRQNEQHPLHVGALVQLNSGSPLYTVSQIIKNEQGYLDKVEVLWHKKADLVRVILPAACVCLQQPSGMHPNLEQFWTAIYQYGLEKLNLSQQANQIAINLTQVYNNIPHLPPRHSILSDLLGSYAPFPSYLHHNLAFRSPLDQKVYKCWLFEKPNLVNVIEHDGAVV